MEAGLATDAEDSPHKRADQIKAEFLIGFAENDDERRPEEGREIGKGSDRNVLTDSF